MEVEVHTCETLNLYILLDFSPERHEVIQTLISEFDSISTIELDLQEKELAINSSQNTTLWTLFAVALTLSMIGIGLYVCGCCSRLRNNRMQNYPLT